MFLTSAKPTIRFASVKTLNVVSRLLHDRACFFPVANTPLAVSIPHSQIAMFHPDAVTTCNVDLENLISDSNRSIATLAITTLLKVCAWPLRGVTLFHYL